MPIELKKDGEFLQGKVGAGIDLLVDDLASVAKAFKDNTPLAVDGVIDLTGKLSAKTGDINFGGGGSTGAVSFRAGVTGGLLFTKAAADLPEPLAALAIPEAGVARFGALRWGYDIGASGKGSVALGMGGSVKFGVEAQSTGEFVVARAWADEPKAGDAARALIQAWRLPRQVASPDDLEPGTWIAAEIDGEFKASIGAQFGYDYSWVRTVAAVGLSGDIGLKIQAAAAVTVGLHAAGKYLLIVARESLQPASRVLRVRVSKLNRKGWNFALDAGVDVTPSTGKFLPEQMDDFVKAVLGVHGPQLVKDLQTFRDWVDPSVPLPERFAGFVSHYAVSQLGGTAGSQVTAARAKIGQVLKAWDHLPAKVSSLLWDQLRGAGVGELEPWLRGVASSDSATIRAKIKETLGSPAFFSTPVGAWLSNVLEGKLLDAALKPSAATTVKDLAKKTLTVLGADVLKELVSFSNERFEIAKIQQAVALTDPKKLEPWLAEKLREFIGAKVDVKGLEQVRKALFTLLAKGQEIYDAALKSLNQTYGFAFHHEYARTTTKTALFDAEFDFDANPALGTFVRAALDGDWTSMLLQPTPGLVLRGAVLTHGLKRTSAVEITLPYFNSRIDKITESIAKMTVVDEGGRLLMYELKADDRIIARNKWQSALTLSGKIAAAITGVRDFTSAGAEEDLRYSYTFRLAARDVRTLQLERRIEPVVKDLFPKAFQETSLHEWTIDLDKSADEVERQSGGMPNGSGNIGDVLASLEVSAPGRAVAAWLKAPAAGTPEARRYLDLSIRMQKTMRRLIPLCYFEDAKDYVGQEMRIAAPLLAYSCLPLTAKCKIQNGLILDTVKDPTKDFYWDITNRDLLVSMLNLPESRMRLGVEMDRIHQMLKDRNNKFAGDYDPMNPASAARLLELALESKLFTGSLLFAESETISHAVNAALEMSKFTANAGKDPEAALESLAEFGEKLTQTFNSGLSSLFDRGNTLRQLGTVIFLEASRAFDPELDAAAPVARLVITLLRSSPDNSAIMKAYLAEGKEPNAKAIAMQQPVVAF